MSVTMKDVLAQIDRDEPDYPALAALGADALPHLEQVAGSGDPLRAAKAAYAAGLIGGKGAAPILDKAAAHGDPQVRIAVASSLRRAADKPAAVVARLLDDEDAGVRKLALRTAGTMADPAVAAKVRAIAEGDQADFVREAARSMTAG
jgi:HEAT repeat protein